MSGSESRSSSFDLLVVVPAYNEERYIEGCISSVCQTLDSVDVKYEIIVVNNGSQDGTAAKVRSMGVSLIEMDRSSVSAARNFGASYSASKYIAFIDADVLLTEEWGAAFSNLIAIGAPSLLTGFQYLTRVNPGWIEKYWFNNIKDKLLNGGNIIVSRDAYEDVGGFDETLKTGEDYDLCARIISSGVEFRRNSRFGAVHLGYPRDIGSFIKRELWHGEGDFKSLATFIDSPVAMIGVFYLVATFFMFLCVVLGLHFFALWIFLAVVLFNLILTFIRFPKVSPDVIAANSAINYFYFLARGLSFFRAIKNISKRY